MMKDDTVIEYGPHEISHVVRYFTKHHGIMNCQVTVQGSTLSISISPIDWNFNFSCGKFKLYSLDKGVVLNKYYIQA